MRILLVIGAMSLAACQGKQVDGGPCKYEAVKGPCTIVSAEASGEKYVKVTARTADGFVLEDNVLVPEGHQAMYVEHVGSMGEVECGGQRIVSGTCSPYEFSLAIPRPEGGADGAKQSAGHEGMHEAMHGEGQGHRAKSMHHRFENAEEWAKVFDDPERDAWQKPDALVASLGLAPDAVVADIGAGTGYFAVRFAAAVPKGEVLATDVEPDMVRYLGERAAKAGLSNLRALESGADDPKLDRKVDVVFLCDVTHHIADRPAYFRRVVAQLNEGGRVVIVDFDPAAPADAPGPPPAMRIGADELAAELVAAGLRKKSVDSELLPYQYVLELVAAD